jgi:hypothetical protein
VLEWVTFGAAVKTGLSQGAVATRSPAQEASATRASLAAKRPVPKNQCPESTSPYSFGLFRNNEQGEFMSRLRILLLAPDCNPEGIRIAFVLFPCRSGCQTA